jgi:DNA-binding transcriptional regulator YiaG
MNGREQGKAKWGDKGAARDTPTGSSPSPPLSPPFAVEVLFNGRKEGRNEGAPPSGAPGSNIVSLILATSNQKKGCQRKGKIVSFLGATNMKAFTKDNVREVRRILGQTQGKFAATIGASKDTIASWETGRNRLSAGMARRISLATGVDERSLLKKGGPLVTLHPARRPFTMEEYERHQKSFWGSSTEESVKGHLSRCGDALGLLFTAAARAGEGTGPARMGGLLDSFIQWCEQARADFRLGDAIDEELGKRKKKLELTKSYAEWREMARTDPDMARVMGFKDEPERDGKETLRLTLETVPIWKPGHSMRGGAGANR